MTPPIPLSAWELVPFISWVPVVMSRCCPFKTGWAGGPEVWGTGKLKVQELEDIITSNSKYMWRRFWVGFGVCIVVFGGPLGLCQCLGLAIPIFLPNCHFTARARIRGAKLQAPACSDFGGGLQLWGFIH